MINKEISKLLREVAASYVIKDEKKFTFQIIAYRNAADAIDGLTVQVEDLHKEGRLDQIPGVGPGIKGRLEELFEKGNVSYWDEVKQGIPAAVFPLMEIPSFGPKKAFKLADHFGLLNADTAIDELEVLAGKGEVAKLEGFGEKSEKDILRAIAEFREGKGKTTRMMLPYAYEIAEELLSYMRTNKNVERIETLGSLRRMMPLVGDIDVAVSTKEPKDVLNFFVLYPKLERVIEKGTLSASIMVSGGHQVDLMVQPPEAFGSLLQHFTGSKNHNVTLREYAVKKGLSLSEKGIKNVKTGKIQTYRNEEGFYKALGMDWVAPELREDTGEVDLALKHKLPKIIELKDIRGDFHIHSSFPIEPSHDLGRNTIEEMLDKAKSLGYEYLGFSEHNPRTSNTTKEGIIENVKARNNEIERLQKKSKIKILKLMETDILPDGRLALPDEALELLDGSIVSIHSVFSMGKEEMTQRVLKGLSNKKAKILAHPTGRLLNKRYGYDLNFEEIFKFCLENNKALEINGYPNRLDLTDSLVRQAIEMGVKLTIDTDSHAVHHMDLMKYGVAIARRGWAKESDIINCLSYNKLIDWFNY